MELKNSETQLENSGESLLCRMDQVEDKVSGLEGNRRIGPLQQKIWKTYSTHTHTKATWKDSRTPQKDHSPHFRLS